MMKGNPNALKFDELLTVLLQKEQFRQNRSNICVVDLFIVANQKGKEKASHYSKQKVASSTRNTKVDKNGDKSKNKGKCYYCREPGHYVKECPKLKEKEAKKKEAQDGCS